LGIQSIKIEANESTAVSRPTARFYEIDPKIKINKAKYEISNTVDMV
jgi:hypothetical protein